MEKASYTSNRSTSPGITPACRQAASTDARAAAKSSGSRRSCKASVSVTRLEPLIRTFGPAKRTHVRACHTRRYAVRKDASDLEKRHL